jgi:asparagine synthetase B (glutamine-hydrolysing)
MTQFADGWARDALLRECEEAYSFVKNPAARSTHAMMLADHLQFAYRFHHRADRLAMSTSTEHRNAFHDTESVHMAINIPFTFKVHGHTTKWVLKQAALRHLPRRLVFVPKGPWALPTEAYLESVADPELFRDGFCSEFFRLEASAVRRLAAGVREAPLPFFGLLAVEVWGRLFFMGERPEQVADRVLRSKPERR